jgi:chromosome segregation ATPase
MTASDNNPGGTAYIYNTNEDEPYNGNICYLPTPPGKKVIYDIEQLSGGEKTIAILSLLVSLQKIAGTPFLILDEVDAYLDPEHEIILEKLFKAITKDNQVIIVTHKSTIFKSAQSLIGTYFNQSKYTSVPLSLKLVTQEV